MNSFTDYYTLLGVHTDASTEEIKAAFKKLARQYHPDVYKGNDANERMSAILQAYQTLHDPELRRHYDVQRSEHSVERPYNYPASASPVRPAGARKQGANEVTPEARRDRQRHYAFPEFFPGKPVRFGLGQIDYELTPDRARELVREGVLRGQAHETKEHLYYCHRCSHRWKASGVETARTLPQSCPKCHASDWSEFLLLRCMHCQAIFESEQIRYAIGAYTYGKKRSAVQAQMCPPYELFPLCPYCGKAHWCPVEEERVQHLQAGRARRDAFLKAVWIGVAVVALLVGSALAMGLLR